MTMELISRLQTDNEEILFVAQDAELPSVMVLDTPTGSKINRSHKVKEGSILLENIQASVDEAIEIVSHTGKKIKVMVLIEEESLRFYKGKVMGKIQYSYQMKSFYLIKVRLYYTEH